MLKNLIKKLRLKTIQYIAVYKSKHYIKKVAKLRKHKPKDLLIPYSVIYSAHSDQTSLYTKYMAAVNHIAIQTMLYKLSRLNVIPKDYKIECIIENPYSLYLRDAVYPKKNQFLQRHQR
jgi:hypothetical protein